MLCATSCTHVLYSTILLLHSNKVLGLILDDESDLPLQFLSLIEFHYLLLVLLVRDGFYHKGN